MAVQCRHRTATVRERTGARNLAHLHQVLPLKDSRLYTRRLCPAFQPEEKDVRPCLAGTAHLLPSGSGTFVESAAYIERNPARARMVEHAGQYEWASSARLALAANPGFLDLSAWQA